MAKTKSFAEKMLKSLKEEQKFTAVKVLRPQKSAKGAVRWDNRIVKIAKGENESDIIGV
jgi:hypothetical protein